MLSFQDTNVLAPHKYFYTISAVDIRRNESARSPETSPVVPKRQPRSPLDPQQRADSGAWMLGDRHVWASGVEHDEYNWFVSCYSPVECFNRLRNRLSSAEMLLSSIFCSLQREFSGGDVGGTWHRVTAPFEFGV